MTINRNNFEAYLLDYLEDNLDPLLTADLMAFLAENPEFEKYLPDYDNRISLSENCECPHKNLLKKGFQDIPEIIPENFDEFCIAACEGLLDDANMKRLSDYIVQHPEKQHDLDLYHKIKLQPDTSVVYTGKAKLKKLYFTSQKHRFLYYAVGIAASFTLLIMLVSRKPSGTAYTESPVKEERVEHIVPQLPSTFSDEAALKKQSGIIQKNVKYNPAFNNIPTSLGEHPEFREESQVLIPLEPITASCIASSAEFPPPALHTLRNSFSLEPAKETNRQAGKFPDSFADSFAGLLIAKVDFWKTAESAIQGFNYLTEAKLSIDKTTDDNGKVTGLLLGMESYAISGNKIK